jgi:hypothetical protein
MLTHFSSISKKNGRSFLVSYLKESHRLTLKALAGETSETMGLPRVATKWGYPLIIPGHLRHKLIDGDEHCTRLVLSLLSMYRGILIPSIPKLNTITDVFTGKCKTLPYFEINQVLRKMNAFRLFKIKPNAHILPNVNSAPNGRHSCLQGTKDAWAYYLSPSLLSHFETVSLRTGHELFLTLTKEIENLPNWMSSINIPQNFIDNYLNPEAENRNYLNTSLNPYGFYLGKLSDKLEAAGKVRIFALADIWTQSVLKPLHDAIFVVLRSLPTDGTFDQLSPIKRLYERGHSKFWSFDLSAATDRLPVDLQEQVLGCLTDDVFSRAWKNLLIDRDWWYQHKIKNGSVYEIEPKSYRYAVGQPMGALSSWGMLALTHHVIVKIAASRVGLPDFEEYALLGDDLVIANEAVANEYLILTKELGLEINLSKSLISQRGVSEFAKRIFRNGIDLSPLPSKLVSTLAKGFKNLPSVLLDMIGRGSMPQLTELTKTEVLRPQILWEIVGPLGFLDERGLSPLLADNTLTAKDYREICLCTCSVVNKLLISEFYSRQNKVQDTMDKLSTLVYDGLMEFEKPELSTKRRRKTKQKSQAKPQKQNDYTKLRVMSPEDAGQVQDVTDYLHALQKSPQKGFIRRWGSLDTPYMHTLMNHLLEVTFEEVGKQPEQIVLPPETNEYTREFTFKFIRDSVEALDQLDSSIPDILDWKTEKNLTSSFKMKFYTKLEDELMKPCYDFTFSNKV